MEMRWSLDELYLSFESQDFAKDYAECESDISTIRDWTEENTKNRTDATAKIETYIRMLNDFYGRFTRLRAFANLTLSVEAKNAVALRYLEKLEQMAAELAQPTVQFEKWLSLFSPEEFDGIVSSSGVLEEHRFYLSEIRRMAKYLLSEKEEVLIARLKNSGGRAWNRLQQLLTSTLMVDIELHGKREALPLPVVRNLAYDPDAKTRRMAYEAELESYRNVEESLAASLNGIKGEVITVNKIRGYSSPLEKTLLESRMNQETLDAMMEAVVESLPAFHRYYRRKAKLMGYTNGLPFYDMFAPLGSFNRQFSYGEAHQFIVDSFRTFSDKLADFADNAFRSRWIDAEPRTGKRGGAFCANLHTIGESRILTNFTGRFNDVTTLAHELGHGYHGLCLTGETILNSNYTMPLAETASIFCESIVMNAILRELDGEEALAVLETSISDAGQVVVDIYSRYLFEAEVFKRRQDHALSVEELKDVMLEAQKAAYGSGLDHERLHPYMWACKPHYYLPDLSFYNFPYTFGLLFAKGVYAEYLKRGDQFVPEYDRLLNATGRNSVVDVAAMAGIDVTSKEFWRGSLSLIEDDIDKFLAASV